MSVRYARHLVSMTLSIRIGGSTVFSAANIQVTHVPYKGSQQVLVDLIGGQIDFTFDLGAAIPHFKTFLDIANHPKTWTDPLISVWQQYRDGLASALDSVLSGQNTSQKALDELVASVQPKLDANGP